MATNWICNYAVVQATLPGIENLGYKFWIVWVNSPPPRPHSLPLFTYLPLTPPPGNHLLLLHPHHLPLLPRDGQPHARGHRPLLRDGAFDHRLPQPLGDAAVQAAGVHRAGRGDFPAEREERWRGGTCYRCGGFEGVWEGLGGRGWASRVVRAAGSSTRLGTMGFRSKGSLALRMR